MAQNPGTRFEQWVKQELAELYSDSRRTKGSGSVNADGDVQAGPFEVECKDNPSQKSVSITCDTWNHTAAAARRNGRIPLVVNKNAHGTYVSLRWQDFMNIITEAVENAE
jgi:hypothetical protein